MDWFWLLYLLFTSVDGFWFEVVIGDLPGFEFCLIFLDVAESSLFGVRNPWIVYGFLVIIRPWIDEFRNVYVSK